MPLPPLASLLALGLHQGEHSLAIASALLVRAKLVRGTLPLVLAMDNGPANRNALVCSYLRAERVTVLWNVPHTPQHNAWIESQHGELKLELEASGALWIGVPDPTQGPPSLSEAGGKSHARHLRDAVARVLRVEVHDDVPRSRVPAPDEGDQRDVVRARVELQLWVHEIAGQRVHGTTGRRPLEVFEAEERSALLPLPASHYGLVL